MRASQPSSIYIFSHTQSLRRDVLSKQGLFTVLVFKVRQKVPPSQRYSSNSGEKFTDILNSSSI